MNNLYFENVFGIGNLYLDHVFYEFEMEPILFVCTNQENRLFLCHCSEIRLEQQWIISECTVETLEKLIDGKTDITSSLLQQETLTMITMDLQGEERSFPVVAINIDSLDMPKGGMLLRCNREDVQVYLEDKKRILHSSIISSLHTRNNAKKGYYNATFEIRIQVDTLFQREHDLKVREHKIVEKYKYRKEKTNTRLVRDEHQQTAS